MIPENITYSHALLDNDKGKVVGIDSLTRESSHTHKFFCPYCHREMYPTFGPIRVNHFRHNGAKCTPDKYLHALAEKTFEDEYRYCIEKRIPFILKIHSPVECFKLCENKKNGICTKHGNIQTIDLTKRYSKIRTEQRIVFSDHFRIPDILLSSDMEEEDNLWVEIWVTHETTENKRNEGKILEIKITSEKDIEQIKEHKIIVSGNSNGNRIFNCEFSGESIINSVNFNILTCTDQERLPQMAYKFIKKNNTANHPEAITPVDLSTIEWMDLGLPSGILWARENIGNPVSIHSALKLYREHLPSKSDAYELMEHCKRHYDRTKKIMVFTGPNGNSIEFKCNEQYTHFWLNDYESIYNKDYGQCFKLGQDESFYINDTDSNRTSNVRLVKWQ